jgi:hypothetical protein
MSREVGFYFSDKKTVSVASYSVVQKLMHFGQPCGKLFRHFVFSQTWSSLSTRRPNVVRNTINIALQLNKPCTITSLPCSSLPPQSLASFSLERIVTRFAVLSQERPDSGATLLVPFATSAPTEQVTVSPQILRWLQLKTLQ